MSSERKELKKKRAQKKKDKRSKKGNIKDKRKKDQNDKTYTLLSKGIVVAELKSVKFSENDWELVSSFVRRKGLG